MNLHYINITFFDIGHNQTEFSNYNRPRTPFVCNKVTSFCKEDYPTLALFL